MEAVCSSKTSADTQQNTWHYIQEDGTLHENYSEGDSMVQRVNAVITEKRIQSEITLSCHAFFLIISILTL
jgi:hypothetical protein